MVQLNYRNYFLGHLARKILSKNILMSAQFSAVEIISAKRDRLELTDEQIKWTISEYTKGAIADEQMSALLMAILLNGMNMREIRTWTDSMIASGERMNWQALSKPTVDKHSTGGVGDKITLPLAPLVAACGAAVPQLSGRGLGHTGGTLDKMESISGWQASISNAQMLKVLQDCGAVICAAGSGLAPADKKLYALRDITGTVPAIPLIASSIMSKKIAEGTSALVLDVKTGNGAFMDQPEKAKELAKTMVQIGKSAGLKISALVTAMDVPLGAKIGNALEVEESIEVLSGGGPQDVVELTLILANEMLALANVKPKVSPEQALKNGQAMDVWRKMVAAQGGDLSKPLPKAKYQHQVLAQDSGKVLSMNALSVGVASWLLGAGRSKPGESVQAGAGIEIHAKPGEQIQKDSPIFSLHTDDESRFARAISQLTDSVKIGDGKVERLPLVIDRIEN